MPKFGCKPLKIAVKHVQIYGIWINPKVQYGSKWFMHTPQLYD